MQTKENRQTHRPILTRFNKEEVSFPVPSVGAVVASGVAPAACGRSRVVRQGGPGQEEAEQGERHEQVRE